MGAGDLPALLGELKARSGLSYAALAKRLHVSTSTLHRYVNGTAVPTEFAPVERLARLCRATPEELVEVHRRWIVADAARGRQRAEAEPRMESRTAAGAGPVGEPRSEPEPEPGPELELEPDSDSESEAPVASNALVPAVGSASLSRTSRTRRLAALAGVGVVLVLGATALAVRGGFPAPGERVGRTAAGASPGGAERPVPRTPGNGGPGPSSGATHQKGNDGNGSNGSNKGDTGNTGERGTGEGVEGDGSPLPSGGPSQDGGAPLTVSTQPQYWGSPCGHPYLVDQTPDRIAPPPNEQDAPGWVSARGAVSAGTQTVRLTVQGAGGGTVVLESLHARVAGTDVPLSWNDYAMGYVGVGCGGNVPKHSFALNLDAGMPRLVSEAGKKDDFPYTVSASDPETFYIDATAKDHYVRWYLELEWSSGGRHGTVRIDDTGNPFRTSGDGGRPQYGYSLDKKRWVRIRREPNGAEYEVSDGG
ncbi:helix-turn-helix domain-containing protein [Streptomyces sp. RGM 3693]|uniref:helix-turn-helix domain-containing protein n=1 Tax=Streptomyces sp. RGM 3693 TaxID=3413284 RepID=UPI003D2AF386